VPFTESNVITTPLIHTDGNADIMRILHTNSNTDPKTDTDCNADTVPVLYANCNADPKNDPHADSQPITTTAKSKSFSDAEPFSNRQSDSERACLCAATPCRSSAVAAAIELKAAQRIFGFSGKLVSERPTC
jgi:hypothetical protein